MKIILSAKNLTQGFSDALVNWDSVTIRMAAISLKKGEILLHCAKEGKWMTIMWDGKVGAILVRWSHVVDLIWC